MASKGQHGRKKRFLPEQVEADTDRHGNRRAILDEYGERMVPLLFIFRKIAFEIVVVPRGPVGALYTLAVSEDGQEHPVAHGVFKIELSRSRREIRAHRETLRGHLFITESVPSQ